MTKGSVVLLDDGDDSSTDLALPRVMRQRRGGRDCASPTTHRSTFRRVRHGVNATVPPYGVRFIVRTRTGLDSRVTAPCRSPTIACSRRW